MRDAQEVCYLVFPLKIGKVVSISANKKGFCLPFVSCTHKISPQSNTSLTAMTRLGFISGRKTLERVSQMFLKLQFTLRLCVLQSLQ